jgi:hypothetical protein
MQMFKPPPSPDQYDTLQDTAGYARPADDFGSYAEAGDHLENLLKLKKMLIHKRRFMAQDVITYPVVYLARAQDIANLQALMASLDTAIAHELELRGSET